MSRSERMNTRPPATRPCTRPAICRISFAPRCTRVSTLRPWSTTFAKRVSSITTVSSPCTLSALWPAAVIARRYGLLAPFPRETAGSRGSARRRGRTRRDAREARADRRRRLLHPGAGRQEHADAALLLRITSREKLVVEEFAVDRCARRRPSPPSPDRTRCSPPRSPRSR